MKTISAVCSRMIGSAGAVLMMVMFSLILHSGVSAQTLQTPCNACKPPGADMPWEAVVPQTVVVLVGECSFTVHVKVRKCIGDDCKEIKIERVDNNAGTCTWLTAEEMQALAVGTMIRDDMLGLGPPSGTRGSQCWRVMRPRCWRKVGSVPPCLTEDSGIPAGTVVPCAKEECCSNVMWVTRDWCDNLFFIRARPEDHADHHGIRDGEIVPGTEREDVMKEWDNQFKRQYCAFCVSDNNSLMNRDGNAVPEGKGGDKMLGPQYPSLPCVFGCSEDIIGRHNEVYERFLERLFSGE